MVLLFFLVFFVLMIVCSLLMKRMICFFELEIFLRMVFRWFLNLLWNFVFVIKVFMLSVIMWWFESLCGMLLWWICSVSFFVMVVFLILGWLMRIGLFLVCWERIWIICWIFLLCLIIGLSLLVLVSLMRLILYFLSVWSFIFGFWFVIWLEFLSFIIVVCKLVLLMLYSLIKCFVGEFILRSVMRRCFVEMYLFLEFIVFCVDFLNIFVSFWFGFGWVFLVDCGSCLSLLLIRLFNWFVLVFILFKIGFIRLFFLWSNLCSVCSGVSCGLLLDKVDCCVVVMVFCVFWVSFLNWNVMWVFVGLKVC